MDFRCHELRLRHSQKNTHRIGVADLLDRLCPGKKTAVHSVDDRLSGNLATTKETAVEALDGILATLDSVEFEVDIALRMRI